MQATGKMQMLICLWLVHTLQNACLTGMDSSSFLNDIKCLLILFCLESRGIFLSWGYTAILAALRE